MIYFELVLVLLINLASLVFALFHHRLRLKPSDTTGNDAE